MGRFYELRKSLSDKQWFRFAAERLLGNRWAEALLIAGSIPFWLGLIGEGIEISPWLRVLGGLAYGALALRELALGLDVYEEQSKRHFWNFGLELALLAFLLLASRFGMLEKAAALLF